MRPPKIVFTVRRLMIAVAVVGVGIGVMQLEKRWVRNREIAHVCEIFERWYRDGDSVFIRDPGRSAYYAAMKIKYQHATAHPWLAVEPSPTEPPIGENRR